MSARRATVLLAALLLAAARPADLRADFELGWRGARAHQDAGRHEAALTAFLALAARAVNDWQRTDALEQAATAAARLDRPDEALAAAGQIPLAPRAAAVRMRLLAGQKRWQEIADEFGSVDFTGWPRTPAGEAFYLRGKARVELKDNEAALPDLVEAAARGTAPEVFFDLAGVASALGDEVRAMDAWRDTQRALYARNAAGGWMFLSSVTARAVVLRRRGMYAHALAETAKAGVENLTGYWLVELLAARAAALAGLGRREEALADCRRALAVENINQWQRAAVEKVLAGLETLGSKPGS